MRPVSFVPFALVLLQAACSSTLPTATTPAAPEPVATPTPVIPPHPEPDPARAPFAAANNALGADLYARLARTPGNFAISPVSIATAMTMTWAGARGETGEQMRRVLHLGTDRDAVLASAGAVAKGYAAHHDGYELSFANQLFGEATYPFAHEFVAQTKDVFGAPLSTVDFIHAPETSRGIVNQFVATTTRDRIRDLLPEGAIADTTRLVLVNAVYMKTKWVSPFAVNATYDEPFVAAAGRHDVPMMHQRATLGFGEIEGARVLDMPYQGGDLAMTVLLPTATDGLDALEKRLADGHYERFVGATKPTDVLVTLPRFRAAGAEPIRLKSILSELGMPLAFGDAADLSGIMKPGAAALHIDDAYHKAFVEVDEQGTVAAAATAVVVGIESTSVRPEPVEFRADHPFVYLVRDVHTNLVLFVGRVADPGA